MRRKTTALFLLLALAALCYAHTPAPYYLERGLLDRLAVLPQPELILDVLQHIALGRNGEITPQQEMSLGLTVGQLSSKAFAAYPVRVHAFHKIGALAHPDAFKFLQSVQLPDIGPDQTGYVWEAARIALKQATLNRIDDAQGKIEFLEQALSEDGRRGVASNWAIDKLCDAGSMRSLSIIEQSIRAKWSGYTRESELRFCQARIRAVTSNPDRARAIGSVLTINVDTVDRRLFDWAISQLSEMRTAAADGELNRFLQEAGRLPARSERFQLFDGYRQRVQAALSRRESR